MQTASTKTFIERELTRLKCPIDSDAVLYLATVYTDVYGTEPDYFKKLGEYLEILADYDIGDTENGKMDRKTVEIFAEDELDIPIRWWLHF